MVFDAPLYALPVAAICLVLWIRGAAVRSEAKVSFEDGGNPVLLRRIRQHGKCTEWSGFALILMMLAEGTLARIAKQSPGAEIDALVPWNGTPGKGPRLAACGRRHACDQEAIPRDVRSSPAEMPRGFARSGDGSSGKRQCSGHRQARLAVR